MKNIDAKAVHAAGGEVLPDGSGVRVAGWKIASRRGPITSDAAAEHFKDALGVLTIPEQWYDANALEITHEASGVTLSFRGEDALRAWRAEEGAEQPVQVASSEQWTRSRKHEMEAHSAKQLKYDWTFTSSYAGTTTLAGKYGTTAWQPTAQQMDRALLTSRDPILFFDDVPLYESELEDNGASQLSVKVRVMPKCWYVLLRFFLRVDGVMVRLREARLFAKFEGEGAVLREVKHQEGAFSELRAEGAPPEGPAYADSDAAAMALSAVAPVGLKKYVMERLEVC